MSSSSSFLFLRSNKNHKTFTHLLQPYGIAMLFFFVFVCSMYVHTMKQDMLEKLVKFLYYRCLKRCLSVSLHKLLLRKNVWKIPLNHIHFQQINSCCFINYLILNQWLVWLIQDQFFKWLRCHPFKLITQSKLL